ncbi:MAG: 3-deoxy-D-manno-octulosonic acid transferase [Deltaproteobacteria bacterium]|nr:3-deoxy-D-manno-octulosonic acid transferase [Deltaproteobacteria bacterium]
MATSTVTRMAQGNSEFSGGWIYALYDGLGVLVSVVGALLFPLLLLTRVRHALSERLGRMPEAATRLRRPLWLHAASVGEVLSAAPLIRTIRQERADLPILVTTTSLTGRATAQAQLGADAVMLLPVDIRWIVNPFVHRLRPCGLVILETELWPVLLRALAQQGVPIAVVSGRVSPSAAARYARAKVMMRAMLRHVGVFAMQSNEDAQRVIALGAPRERVHVLGNLKFARDGLRSSTATAQNAVNLGSRIVLIAASTHPGEEALVLDAYEPLQRADPKLLLVVAPRRPERFDEVAQLLDRRGLRYQRRSRLAEEVSADTHVLLLDSVGELLDLFPQARAVFVGGTIAAVGGHNVLEPALFGKPVCFGPQTANVANAAALLLEAGAAIRVHDSAELQEAWRRLVGDATAAAAMGERGRAVVGAQADVAQRSWAVVRANLSRSSTVDRQQQGI